MDKKNKRNDYHLPVQEEIAQVYQTLGLSGMLGKRYDRDEQLNAFRKFSLYTDNSPCYATGNTKPYNGDL